LQPDEQGDPGEGDDDRNGEDFLGLAHWGILPDP
jgi:hypothetical protein